MNLMNTTVESSDKPRYSLWQLLTYMLRLGAPGFGGPVALVGYMQRNPGGGARLDCRPS